MLEKYLYVLQEVRSIIYVQQFIHPLSVCSRGSGTSFAFTSYILVSTKFCNVTFLNNFYFVSFFYHLFICQHRRKIRLATLIKAIYINFSFKVSLVSFFHICLYFWTQTKVSEIFKTQFLMWKKSTLHCIYITIFVQQNLYFINHTHDTSHSWSNVE